MSSKDGYGDIQVIGAKSDCSYYYELSIKSSEKVPNSNPGSNKYKNRPAEYDNWEEIYWTDSMEIHHLAAHNNMNFNSL